MLFVIAILTATTVASPLGVVWKQKVACPRAEEIHATTDAFVWIDKGTLARYDRKTGAALPAFKLSSKAPKVTATDGSSVVIRDPDGFELLDATSGKRRWRRAAKIDAAEPAMAFAGANVAILRIGAGKQPKREIELADRTTGKPLWKIALATSGNVRGLKVGASLLFVIQNKRSEWTATITALALKDGGVAWTKTGVDLESTSSFAAALDDELVVAGKRAVTWFDVKGATSSIPLELPVIGPLTADRLYVLADADRSVVALDRKRKQPLWTAPRNGVTLGALVRASETSVFITDDDQLVELDAKTGNPIAKLGIADGSVKGFDGSPQLLDCDGRKQLIAFDASAADLPIEAATITGTIKCRECASHQRLWVRVAGLKVPVDPNGRFKVAVRSRGKLEMTVQFIEPVGQFVGDFSLPTLELTGKAAYDLGTVEVIEAQEGD